MNNPDYISESLETIFFWVKILTFFEADPGSRMEKNRILDKHPRSATLNFCFPLLYSRINCPWPFLLAFRIRNSKTPVFERIEIPTFSCWTIGTSQSVFGTSWGVFSDLDPVDPLSMQAEAIHISNLNWQMKTKSQHWLQHTCGCSHGWIV